jgi:hypothetical protein
MLFCLLSLFRLDLAKANNSWSIKEKKEKENTMSKK